MNLNRINDFPSKVDLSLAECKEITLESGARIQHTIIKNCDKMFNEIKEELGNHFLYYNSKYHNCEKSEIKIGDTSSVAKKCILINSPIYTETTVTSWNNKVITQSNTIAHEFGGRSVIHYITLKK